MQNAKPEAAQPNPAPGIQKPVDIRSSVKERTLQIPKFLQDMQDDKKF